MTGVFFTRQFAVFVLTGGTAAAVNFASRILYSHWTGFSTAIVLAYLTGMITAFVLAKLFVFKNSRQGIGRSALIFSLVNVVAVAQTWAISMLLAYYLLPWLGITRFVLEISHAAGVAVPVFTSYIGHKHWSFK